MDAFPIRSNQAAPPSACGFRTPSSHAASRVPTSVIISSNAASAANRGMDGDFFLGSKRASSPAARNPPSAYENFVPNSEPKTSFIDIGRDVVVKPTGETYRRYFKQQVDTMAIPSSNKFRLTKEILERHDRSSGDQRGGVHEDSASIWSSLPSSPDELASNRLDTMKLIDFDYFDKKRPAPALVSSFSLLMPPRVVTRDLKFAEVQTEPRLVKKTLPSLNDYQTWLTDDVDPLISDLRKHLMTERPADFGEYLVAYGLSLISKSAPPTTVEERRIAVTPIRKR